eukprot:2316755-Rhodomonas_salina.3
MREEVSSTSCRYALPSTDLANGHPGGGEGREVTWEVTLPAQPAGTSQRMCYVSGTVTMLLRIGCAMLGTYRGYLAMQVLRDVRYSHSLFYHVFAVRCLVLTQLTPLQGGPHDVTVRDGRGHALTLRDVNAPLYKRAYPQGLSSVYGVLLTCASSGTDLCTYGGTDVCVWRYQVMFGDVFLCSGQSNMQMSAPPLDCEIKSTQPQSPHALYQGCGCLSLISQCPTQCPVLGRYDGVQSLPLQCVVPA